MATDGVGPFDTPDRPSNMDVSHINNDTCAIFVHAGAGYHSLANEQIHLQACHDAAKAALQILRSGASAVDAVEIAIKILEDREITNAGYGSNLAMDGVVECDASIIDHHGRSGAVGAVAQIKNPIALARRVYDHTSMPLTLRRVPPNLLVGQGATDFAYEQGIAVLPYDALVSPAARERWIRWKSDLKYAEHKARKLGALPATYRIREMSPEQLREEEVRKRMRQEHANALLQQGFGFGRGATPVFDRVKGNSTPASEASSGDSWKSEEAPPSAPSTPSSPSSQESELLNTANEAFSTTPNSIRESSRSAFINSTQKVPTLSSYGIVLPSHASTDVEMSDPVGPNRRSNGPGRGSMGDGSSDGSQSDASGMTMTESLVRSEPTTPTPLSRQALPVLEMEDDITDTVGAIAIDCKGNIACGASSGGIGMKYRGRVGPAALVGIGAAVIPIDSDDMDKTCVATVTSGTGEHMVTTMAATVCAERIYQSVQKGKGGTYESVTEDEALRSMISKEFMAHPSVKNSSSAGAIGILGVKKTRAGIHFYYAHNTDSFAIASMHANDVAPVCTMSRSKGNGLIAQGGRPIRTRKKSRRGPSFRN